MVRIGTRWDFQVPTLVRDSGQLIEVSQQIGALRQGAALSNTNFGPNSCNRTFELSQAVNRQKYASG